MERDCSWKSSSLCLVDFRHFYLRSFSGSLRGVNCLVGKIPRLYRLPRRGLHLPIPYHLDLPISRVIALYSHFRSFPCFKICPSKSASTLSVQILRFFFPIWTLLVFGVQWWQSKQRNIKLWYRWRRGRAPKGLSKSTEDSEEDSATSAGQRKKSYLNPGKVRSSRYVCCATSTPISVNVDVFLSSTSQSLYWNESIDIVH